MLSQALVIILTAVLSSLITLGVAYYFIRRLIQERGEKTVREITERFKNDVGPELEQRVAQGVRSGFASLPSREVLRDTTRNMAKTGVDIVGDTLKPFLKQRGSYRQRDRYYDDPLDPDIDD
ncbi:MAG: hypothetical protein R3208_02855 [Ketobacteraceae bacterium]|nr:hypothetical protein [Ketobacteraceae bacterium]